MNKEIKLEITKERLHKLKENNKNVKSTEVVRKLERQIRNMEK